MKKLIAIMLAACCLLSLAACGAKEADYKLGLGVVLNADSSAENNAQVDGTVAAVILDDAGKIVQCRLDVAQNKMDVTGGAVDPTKTFQTKMELGDAYGMVAYGAAIAEWDAQAKAFEAYVVGKTAAEVKAIATTTNDHGYVVAADDTLYAGCTMQISEFIEAVAKACEDKAAVAFKAGEGFKLGVAAVSDASESTAATADADGAAKLYSEFGAAVVGADGKILAALNDATQPKISVSTAGAITGVDYKGTKRELGSDYGMVAYGAAIAEWDAQSAAFSAYVAGKTAAEVRGIETKTNDHGYAVSADETLYASCTMQITGMMEVIARAADYAR